MLPYKQYPKHSAVLDNHMTSSTLCPLSQVSDKFLQVPALQESFITGTLIISSLPHMTACSPFHEVGAASIYSTVGFWVVVPCIFYPPDGCNTLDCMRLCKSNRVQLDNLNH